MKTKSPGLTDARQARQSMTALPYKTKGGSNNYLHIGVDATELAIGDQIKVNLNLGGSPGEQNQDFTCLVGALCVCICVYVCVNECVCLSVCERETS